MPARPIFYLPHLRQEFAPRNLPSQILFIPCKQALHGITTSNTEGILPEYQNIITSFCKQLPLEPNVARAVLAEIMQLGSNFSKESSSAWQQKPTINPQHLAQNELSDLKNFAQTGSKANVSNEQVQEKAILHAKINAQKTLLLAYELEEHTATIHKLQKNIAHSHEKLLASFSEDSQEQEVAIDLPEFKNTSQGGPSEIPWRLILDASLAFLPEDSIFYADDVNIALELSQHSHTKADAEELAVLGLDNLAGQIHKISLCAWEICQYPKAIFPWQERLVTVFFPLP